MAVVACIQNPKETVATGLSGHQMLPMVAKTIICLPCGLRACLLRSKGLKDATCMGWFGDDWDCSVGCPPEAMIT